MLREYGHGPEKQEHTYLHELLIQEQNVARFWGDNQMDFLNKIYFRIISLKG